MIGLLESELEQEQAAGVFTRLSRDLANAAKNLTVREARYLVDAYYMFQENRISAGHQERTLEEGKEPHDLIGWLANQNMLIENQLKRALNIWGDHNVVSTWAKSICGIGPVISAGLLAHINIQMCPTAGHIWRFAGLDASTSWLGKDKAQKLVSERCGKGEKITTEDRAELASGVHRALENLDRIALRLGKGKITRASFTNALAMRPYNQSLKTLCAFKLGESFVKVQSNDNDIYGKVYVMRKLQEQERNEAGIFADQAAARVGTVGKDTDAHKAYAAGKLPPAQIHARARRYAVKLFLAHYHAVAYFHEYKAMPPFPYVFEHMAGHVHFVAPPNVELVDGMAAALADYEVELRKKTSKA